VFPNSWPGGNLVIIVNERAGWSTAYGHLDSIHVADQQEVTAGMVIGTVGSTGMTTGPHLHYEVRSAHGNVDPAPLIASCSL
jgi:murein DD-endopeptidase MepM/ murein hydrolase activator NlpD